MSWIQACELTEVPPGASKAIRVDEDRSIALFNVEGDLYATDNQCPHMGFPLTRGTIRGGVLTCDWHGRNFDLRGGGCFNRECGDLPVFVVEVREGTVWIDLGETGYHRRDADLQLLWEGLLNSERWTISKALALLLDGGVPEVEIVEMVLQHATRHIASQHGADGGEDVGRLLDGLAIAQRFGEADRLITLTTAVAATMGRASDRLEVVPMPKHPSWREMERFVRDAARNRQAGRIERCLLTIHENGQGDSLLPLLYGCVAEPHFIGYGDTFVHLARLEEAVRTFGWDKAGELVFNLGSKLIGRNRAEPARFRQDAVALMEALGPAVDDAVTSADRRSADGKPYDEAALLEALTSADVERAFRSLAQVVIEGAAPTDLITTFVVHAADRMARAPINADPGWEELRSELHLAASLRPALECAGPRVAVRGLFACAWELFSHRWINLPYAPFAALDGVPEAAAEDVITRMKTLDPEGATAAAQGALRTGAGDDFLEEIIRTVVWDGSASHLLPTLRATLTEWALGYEHPARHQLIVGLVRYAADVRTSKDNATSTTTAINFARGRTNVDVFE